VREEREERREERESQQARQSMLSTFFKGGAKAEFGGPFSLDSSILFFPFHFLSLYWTSISLISQISQKREKKKREKWREKSGKTKSREKV